MGCELCGWVVSCVDGVVSYVDGAVSYVDGL